MNTKLKLAIEQAIDKTIQNLCEDDLWDGYIHHELAQQMTNAAEAVFDSSMSGQKFAGEQGA